MDAEIRGFPSEPSRSIFRPRPRSCGPQGRCDVRAGDFLTRVARSEKSASEIPFKPICVQGREVVRGYLLHVDKLLVPLRYLPEGMVRQCPPHFTNPRREGCGFGGW